MKRKPRKNEGTQKFGSLIWPWGKFLVPKLKDLIYFGVYIKSVVKKLTSNFAQFLMIWPKEF